MGDLVYWGVGYREADKAAGAKRFLLIFAGYSSAIAAVSGIEWARLVFGDRFDKKPLENHCALLTAMAKK